MRNAANKVILNMILASLRGCTAGHVKNLGDAHGVTKLLHTPSPKLEATKMTYQDAWWALHKMPEVLLTPSVDRRLNGCEALRRNG